MPAPSSPAEPEVWDYVIVGSGFGGSVSALRLSEKGYRVLVLEKGSRLGADDFPKTNWNLKKWMWLPELGWRGLFKMTFFPHVTILSGVGVGGGSLVYANTLPKPKDEFFVAPSWGHLADWKKELAPHYARALKMLGATVNPQKTRPDEVLEEIAKDLGRPEAYGPTTVAVYFGQNGVTVPDPYFKGEGPERTGCTACGGCMLGCRFGAKNTLDKNYLWLAEKRGCRIEPDTEVTWVRPREGGGYALEALQGRDHGAREKQSYQAKNVVFAGGVLGTVELLLKLRQSKDGLPNTSECLGNFVRTNSEALLGVTRDADDGPDFSKGIAIGSILHTDDHSHLEPVRYSEGSGFFRTLGGPMVSGAHFGQRLGRMLGGMVKNPRKTFRGYFSGDFAKKTIILLYMRTLEGHLRLKLGRDLTTGFFKGLTTSLEQGPAPSANIPEAAELAHRVEEKIGGTAMTLITETLMAIPTTAHILGGCTMGDSAATGVIDHRHRLFGYEGLFVIDGSAVSANPGVNPSLTITALAERAMTFIPARS